MTSLFVQLNNLAILISGIILPLILVALIIIGRRRCESAMAAPMQR